MISFFQNKLNNVNQLQREFTPPGYSIFQDEENKKAEINTLIKQVAIAQDLLFKVSNKLQAEKLTYKIKNCVERKQSLTKEIAEIEYTKKIIDNCTDFFLFFKKLYQLVIEKINSDGSGQINVQLVEDLRKEESKLCEELFIKGDFAAICKAVKLSPYQASWESYTTHFCREFQNLDDSYSQLLAILRALINEFIKFNACSIDTDFFDLNEVKTFLTTNTAIPLPESSHRLIGLRVAFFYHIVLKYLELKPVNINFQPLINLIEFENAAGKHCLVTYNSPIKTNFIDILENLEKDFGNLEQKFKNFILKKEKKECAVKDDAVIFRDYEIKEATKLALIFYQSVEKSMTDIEGKIKKLTTNYVNAPKMIWLLTMLLHQDKSVNLLDLLSDKIGFNLKESIEESYIDCIKNNKDALDYFYHIICRSEKTDLSVQAVQEFLNKFSIDTLIKKTSFSIKQYDINDLIDFSYFYYFTLKFSLFNEKIFHFKEKIFLAKIFILNVFIYRNCNIIECEKQNLKKKILNFPNKSNGKSYFQDQKKNLLDEIDCILHRIQDAILTINEAKKLEQKISNKMLHPLSRPDENNLIDTLHILGQEELFFKSSYDTIKRYECTKNIKSINQKKHQCSSNDGLIKNETEILIKDFCDLFSLLLAHLSVSIDSIESLENKTTTADKLVLINRFSSAKGQFSSDMIKLAEVWKSLTNDKIEKINLIIEIPEKFIEFVEANQIKEEKEREALIIELRRTSEKLTEKFDRLIDKMIQELISCNQEAESLLKKITFYTSFSKSFRKKIKIFYKYSRLIEQYNQLKELIYLVKLNENSNIGGQIIALDHLVKDGEKYQEKIFSIKKELINKEKIKGKNSPDSLSCESDRDFDDINRAQTIDCKTETFLSTDVKYEKDRPSVTESAVTVNFDVSKEKTEYSIKDSLKDITDWLEKFQEWKFEKNTPLFALFVAIENCSIADLRITKTAFLKCLTLYEMELNEKRSEFNFLQNKAKDFFNGRADSLPNCLASIQWIDISLAKISSCKELIHQNDNDEMIASASSETQCIENLSSLLALYVRSAVKYDRLRHDYADEKYNKDDIHRFFIKSVLKKDSLDHIEKEGSISKFSEKITKIKQLEVRIQHEYENKKKIIEKLKLIANHQFLMDFISRINIADTATLIVNNTKIQLQSQQGTPYFVSEPAVMNPPSVNQMIPTMPVGCCMTSPPSFYLIPQQPMNANVYATVPLNATL